METTTASLEQPPHHAKSSMRADIDDWVIRATATAKDPSGIVNPTGTAPWSSAFFGCFSPIDTCLLTCCCPCVTFGRTHHRLRKERDLKGWSILNASCLGWWAASCFGLHSVPTLLQRHDIREKAQPKLEGNFVMDVVKACCCTCCDLIQQDKEADFLLKKEEQAVVFVEPGLKTGGMEYTPQ